MEIKLSIENEMGLSEKRKWDKKQKTKRKKAENECDDATTGTEEVLFLAGGRPGLVSKGGLFQQT